MSHGIADLLTDTATIPNRQECRIDRPHDATECDGYHLDLSDT